MLRYHNRYYHQLYYLTVPAPEFERLHLSMVLVFATVNSNWSASHGTDISAHKHLQTNAMTAEVLSTVDYWVDFFAVLPGIQQNFFRLQEGETYMNFITNKSQLQWPFLMVLLIVVISTSWWYMQLGAMHCYSLLLQCPSLY